MISPDRRPARVFILSPALLTGVRGRRILRGESDVDLVRTLHGGGTAPLGDVFASISSLYFRGKRAYAAHFGKRGGEAPSSWVVTPDRGLVGVDEPVSLDDLARMAARDIDPVDTVYRDALVGSARSIEAATGADAVAVLLGSIASDKYLPPLLEVWHERLLFPAAFVGRGDMSRGGLLLRAVESDTELAYLSATDAGRRGRRPPRLD